MSKIQDFLGRYKLVYQPTSPLMKAVAAAAIAVCTVTLIALRLTQWDHLNTLDALTQQAAMLQQENEDLQSRIDQLGTVASYRQIAAEVFGLVDPDTIVIESD